MKSLPRSRKPLQPVRVVGRFLKKPICCCELLPQGSPGVLLIDHTPYLCSYVSELPPAPAEPRVDGYRLVKHDGTCYEIDVNTRWGGWECSCPDSVYRPERPNGCKHISSLKQALRHVAVIPPGALDEEEQPVCRTLAERGAA